MTPCVKDKIKEFTPLMEDGDCLLVEGTGFLSDTIMWSDKANYSHMAVLSSLSGEPAVVQSMARGTVPFLLFQELRTAKDFALVKFNFPKEDKLIKIKESIRGLEGKAIPYNFLELPRILLEERCGLYFKNIQGNKHREVCSVYASITYGGLYPITAWQERYKERGFITPGDIDRIGDTSQVTIIR